MRNFITHTHIIHITNTYTHKHTIYNILFTKSFMLTYS